MLWTLRKGFYRVYHKIMKYLTKLINIREPELLTGQGCSNDMAKIIKDKGITNVLVVTGKRIMGTGMVLSFFASLKANGVKYTVFDDVQPNPIIANIEAAVEAYQKNNCQGIVAFGGGSPIDCAKAAAARIANPQISVRKLKGVLKVKRAIPPFFVIPTTAGTGSEATVAAIVSDTDTHEKYAIIDPKLVPIYAALDPQLTIDLPPDITAATGLDALSHAVEAYISCNATAYTDKCAQEAVKIIFNNLEVAYKDGSNLEARKQMMLASYKAGVAFTRAYVGYAHAFAHSIGGIYNVSHGYLVAVILPYVLDYYGSTIYKKLADLAIVIGIESQNKNTEILAKEFIQRLRELNKQVNMPEVVKEIQDSDIPLIVKRTLQEGNPGYPVPKILNQTECTAIVKKLMLRG